MVIERGIVRTENGNNPHGFGLINPDNFSPFPKNPVIARFFREIGRADELGSGVRNLMKYGKDYGGDPELIEGDIFRIDIKYPDTSFQSNRIKSGVESEMAQQILSFLATDPLSKSELARKLGTQKPTRYLNDLIRKLIETILVEYTIPDKPQSSKQKYRLTKKGRGRLKSQTPKPE